MRLIANAQESTPPVLTHPEYLSKRTQQADKNRSQQLINIIGPETSRAFPEDEVGYLAELIDLHQQLVRR